MWVLLLDEQVLTAIIYIKKTLGFYQDAIGKLEVRGVLVIGGRDGIDQVAFFIDLFLFNILNLCSYLVFQT